MVVRILIGGAQAGQPEQGIRVAFDAGRHFLDQAMHFIEFDES